MGEGLVLRSDRGGVAVLTLNRPDRLNAWTPALSSEYFDLLEACAADPGVRAIVVTGAGRGFCAGADMERLQGIGSNGAEADRPDERPQTFPLTIGKPLIAALNGPCAGIGLVLALMCDVRFAAPGIKITTAFARRGLVAEHGISWLLPRLIGPSRALDLLMSGRIVLSEEAAEMGLVNRVTEDAVEAAVAYADDLARNCSPASMAAMKQQVWEDLSLDLGPALEKANGLMVESFAADDFREGVASFVEKREPQFTPLG